MNKFIPAISFVVGAAVGAAVSAYFTKKYYDKLVVEEIESVKKVFCENYSDEDPADRDGDSFDIFVTGTSVDEVENEHTNKPDIMEYASKFNDKDYIDYSTAVKDYSSDDEEETEEEKEEVIHNNIFDMNKEDTPYVIPPDEFGENEDYSKVSFTYYADGVLADDINHIVEDVDRIVGIESLDHFGEWEDDSVFVRNDRRMTDYEILLDTRTYSEMIKDNPHLKEVLYDESPEE